MTDSENDTKESQEKPTPSNIDKGAGFFEKAKNFLKRNVPILALASLGFIVAGPIGGIPIFSLVMGASRGYLQAKDKGLSIPEQLLAGALGGCIGYAFGATIFTAFSAIGTALGAVTGYTTAGLGAGAAAGLVGSATIPTYMGATVANDVAKKVNAVKTKISTKANEIIQAPKKIINRVKSKTKKRQLDPSPPTLPGSQHDLSQVEKIRKKKKD